MSSHGSPYPLGATCIDGGVNFALFSANADQVTLCLFDQNGQQQQIPVTRRSGDIWHVHVPGISEGQVYGYRVGGPWRPESGQRFNPNKLLLDPYAKSLTRVPTAHVLSYDYQMVAGEMVPDTRDNAAEVAKSVVVQEAASLASSVRVPLADSLIYELHVKGFTRMHPDLPALDRGRYAGLRHPRVIDYLKDLGVTSLELLPVHEFVDEPFLTERGLTNYWGYNSIAFFAPTRRYARHEPIGEFRAMVEQLHDAGIEVILDVVYNHTAEGNHLGPTFSYRGIDNTSYYRLETGNPGINANDSGCGNSLNAQSIAVIQLVLDSLRYWVSLGVDGFRFDLATSLGRNEGGFSSQHAFFQAVQQDPVLNRVKLIAEPWDLGPGGYQLGQFPVHWSEWNDQYRDTVRQFWRGDSGILPGFASNLHGASDLFERPGRAPQAGINFLTSHDGFTLADLVSHIDKHNEANHEANHDGHHANFSFNCGVEGPTDDAGVLNLRHKQQRNLIATLLVSQGLPMLVAGDEIGRTQQGNNNAYCQDSEISWVNWALLDTPDGRRLHDFTRAMISLRKRWAGLRCERFIHGVQYQHYAGIDEIDWYHPRGTPMLTDDWQNAKLRTLGLMLHGAAIFPNADGDTHLVLVLFNANRKPVSFTLPCLPLSGQWSCALTSGDRAAGSAAQGQAVVLEPHSMSLFELNVKSGE